MLRDLHLEIYLTLCLFYSCILISVLTVQDLLDLDHPDVKLKPPEGQKGRKEWVSRVDWRGADRVDPRSVNANKLRLPELDREIRGEMESAALTTNAQKRLDDIAGPAPDRINVG